jgi:hypothetical protein
VSMEVEGRDVTGAWYWEVLPTGPIVYERQKCAHVLKSSEECLMVICCRNALEIGS